MNYLEAFKLFARFRVLEESYSQHIVDILVIEMSETVNDFMLDYNRESYNDTEYTILLAQYFYEDWDSLEEFVGKYSYYIVNGYGLNSDFSIVEEEIKTFNSIMFDKYGDFVDIEIPTISKNEVVIVRQSKHSIDEGEKFYDCNKDERVESNVKFDSALDIFKVCRKFENYQGEWVLDIVCLKNDRVENPIDFAERFIDNPSRLNANDGWDYFDELCEGLASNVPESYHACVKTALVALYLFNDKNELPYFEKYFEQYKSEGYRDEEIKIGEIELFKEISKVYINEIENKQINIIHNLDSDKNIADEPVRRFNSALDLFETFRGLEDSFEEAIDDIISIEGDDSDFNYEFTNKFIENPENKDFACWEYFNEINEGIDHIYEMYDGIKYSSIVALYVYYNKNALNHFEDEYQKSFKHRYDLKEGASDVDVNTFKEVEKIYNEANKSENVLTPELKQWCDDFSWEKFDVLRGRKSISNDNAVANEVCNIYNKMIYLEDLESESFLIDRCIDSFDTESEYFTEYLTGFSNTFNSYKDIEVACEYLESNGYDDKLNLILYDVIKTNKICPDWNDSYLKVLASMYIQENMKEKFHKEMKAKIFEYEELHNVEHKDYNVDEVCYDDEFIELYEKFEK